MDTEAIQRWVLEVHRQTKPAEPRAELSPDGPATAEADTGLWWGVLNIEGYEHKPESLWQDKDDAERRANVLNTNRYPSWQVMPAALSWWMRNEVMPDGLGQTADPTTWPNTCEHGDHSAPAGQRFCSAECERCESESDDPDDEGCSGLCGLDDEGQPADTKVSP